MMDVPIQADDFRGMKLILVKPFHVDGGLLAEWIRLVQIFVRESLIDDGHVLFLDQFLLVEEAAGTQRNIHGVEIAGPDNLNVGAGRIGGGEGRLPKEVQAGSSTKTGSGGKA